MVTTKQDHDESKDLLNLAIKYEEQAEFARNKANSIIPENTEDYYDKGIHLYRQGMYEGSIKALDQAINLNLKHWEAYKIKFFCLKELGQCQEAEQINTVLKKEKQKPITLKQIGFNLKKNKKNLDKNPNCAKAHYEMGKALVITGNNEEAITNYNAGLCCK